MPCHQTVLKPRYKHYKQNNLQFHISLNDQEELKMFEIS